MPPLNLDSDKSPDDLISSGTKPTLNVTQRTIPGNRRPFGNPAMIRPLIYDNVLKETSNIQPVKFPNSRYSLSLHDVDYSDPDTYSLKQQKEAILGNKTLDRRLAGTWRLTDEQTGQPVEDRRMTLARIPHMTERGTFIINGTEYSLASQMRLLPGIYTRQKANNTIESHANFIPGKGISHRYFFDPETSMFRFNVGQSKVPLISVMRAMGATDKQLRENWGDEIFAINQAQDSPHVIDKLYQRMVKKPNLALPTETKSQALATELSNMELNPEVTKRTLGHPYAKLSSDAILAATRKLLAVNRLEAEPDDRDHLAFQTLMGPEDLIPERIGKDKTTLNRLLWDANTRHSLGHIQPGVFTKAVQAAFLSSGLGQAAEEVNAAELIDHQGRITRLGEGGMGVEAQGVPEESRAVHPSQMAFIDPVKAVECLYHDNERPQYFMTKQGWKACPDITDSDEFACLVNNTVEYHKAEKIHVYDYEGQICVAENKCIGYMVTPNHRMWIQPFRSPKAAWRFEEAQEIHDRYMRFQIGGHKPYIGIYNPSTITIGKAELNITDWCELLGWIVSDHCKPISTSLNVYCGINISLSRNKNPSKHQKLQKLIHKLDLNYTYDDLGFSITDPDVVDYLKLPQINLFTSKCIPEYYFEIQESNRSCLLSSLFNAIGKIDNKGKLSSIDTASERLANDVHRFCFDLGLATNVTPKTVSSKFCNVRVYEETTRTIDNNAVAHRVGQPTRYSLADVKGKVYCVTVPGNMIFTRLTSLNGFWSGNSFKTGVDLRTAFGAQKATDGTGRMFAPFRDPKTNKFVYRSPQEVADLVITFPGEMAKKSNVVAAMAGGKLKFVHKSTVDLELPSMENTFSPLTNMIPMKSGVKGQRVSMGARMLAQALPLQNAEAPFVQSEIPGLSGLSYERLYGQHMGTVTTSTPGKVMKVTPEEIVVKGADGKSQTHQLYNSFPMNRKTYWHNTPLVKEGDKVDQGQILAKSNFTDKDGTAALGINARVAYLPFEGLNYEDAVVISESMANRMTSEHMYQHGIDWNDDIKKGKRTFMSIFPAAYDKKTLSTLDDDGIIKPGQVVEYGQPLIAAVREKERAFNQVHRSGKSAFSDASVIWDHHSPGMITDVVNGRKGVMIAVKSYTPMTVGDKLAGRYGDKSVVAKIVPDEHMPRDEQDRPFEILTSPMGVISRINPTQVVEAALGKIASVTGKPYKITDFSKENLTQFALDELKKNKMSELETVTDPKSGRQIPGVLAGNRFFMKLHHMADHKSQGRSAGGGYDSSGVPSKGGTAGSKRVSLADTNALLAHGALSVLHDAHVIRGQSNPDYWLAFFAGKTPPNPKVPIVYEKFLNELKGSGINVVRDADKLHVMALTNSDIDHLTEGRELTNTDTVDWKEGLKPKKGGLFDQGLTGGHGGNKWSKIKLAEPMPSPVMEEPIRRLLDLTEDKFLSVLAGKMPLPDTNKTGPLALKEAIGSLNVDQEISKAQAAIASGKKSLRDKAIRKLGYLQATKRLNIKPTDWFLDSVPVLPPTFRPVGLMMGGKSQMVADPNYLYKEVFDANQELKSLTGQVDDVSEERLNVYNAFKAVTGLGDPIQPKNQERQVKGLLRTIFGSSPKLGTVQFKLLGASVDMVGRGVIVPDPDMDLDHIGIPETKAWEVYKPFVIRGLVRTGMPRLDAMRAVENKDKGAKEILVKEMNHRPVLVNRYPVLHKYGLMAFWPKMVQGETIHLSPIVTKPYSGDFDGNCIVFSSKISLYIQWSLLYNDIRGQEDLISKWSDFKMRLTGNSEISIKDNDTYSTIQIGNFPKIGQPTLDKNNAEIYNVPNGLSVLSYDHQTGKTGYYRISGYTVDKNHACVKMTTARNKSVTVSNNESLAVHDQTTGGIIKVKPEDAIGKLVPFVKEAPITGTEYDFEFGWWFASMVSDGWETGNTIGYSKCDDAKRAEFVRIALDKFPDSFSVCEYRETKDSRPDKFGDSVKVHLNGLKLVQQLTDFDIYSGHYNLGNHVRGALRKKLPEKLLNNGSRECLLGLLSGLLDGDAVVRWSMSKAKKQFDARMYTSSPSLRDDILELGRKLSVRLSVTTTPANKERAEAYCLVPCLSDLYTIAKELKLIGAAAAANMKEFVNQPNKPNDNLDFVPIDTFEATQLLKDIYQLRQMALYATVHKSKSNGHILRSTAARVIDMLTPTSAANYPNLTRVVNNKTIYWDIYKTSEVVESQDVFDLIVPETKVFATDFGLIIYDTMQYHVPASDAARDEAITKMLPSANLFSTANFKALYVPNQEYVQGLHAVSTMKDSDKPTKTYATKQDAINAYRRGEIHLGTNVEILDKH